MPYQHAHLQQATHTAMVLWSCFKTCQGHVLQAIMHNFNNQHTFLGSFMTWGIHLGWGLVRVDMHNFSSQHTLLQINVHFGQVLLKASHTA